MYMTTTNTTHTGTDNTGRTIGWVTEQTTGPWSLITDNGVDLLDTVHSVTEARAALLEHRHQRMH